MPHIFYHATTCGTGRIAVVRHDVVVGHIDIDHHTSRFVFLKGTENTIAYEIAEKTLDELKAEIERSLPSLD